MRELLSLCVIIIVVCVVIIFFQVKYSTLEQFNDYGVEIDKKNSDKNKLLIKKTKNYKKIFENTKYSVWEPIPINDYFPLGHYISYNKKKPENMAILVKNKLGLKSKDKPIRFDVVSITNKEYAIWQPIGNKDFISLGVIYGKQYPSKYIIRCIPKHFCKSSYINNKIISNKIKKNDKGYELWSINNSNLFVCNNINNKNNLNNLKKVYRLNENYLDIEKKFYVRNTNKYKKICSYKDTKLNKDFYIWRPIPPDNFCSLGDIILDIEDNPNNMLNTIVAHNSLCKIPLNYGNRSIYKIKTNTKKYNISFWRPVPHNNYYFFGDIVVMGDEEPEADNIIYSISIDYLKTVNYDTHKIIYNNIDNKNPFSIWDDENNFFMVSKGYKNIKKNRIILNRDFVYSDYDMLDLGRKIILKFKTNKKTIKSIDENQLIDIIKTNLSSKLDINLSRLNTIKLNSSKKEIILNIKARGMGTDEVSINNIVKKLKNIIDHEDIKIYNKTKDNYYISIDELFTEENIKNIALDNSLFREKFKL